MSCTIAVDQECPQLLVCLGIVVKVTLTDLSYTFVMKLIRMHKSVKIKVLTVAVNKQ